MLFKNKIWLKSKKEAADSICERILAFISYVKVHDVIVWLFVCVLCYVYRYTEIRVVSKNLVIC